MSDEDRKTFNMLIRWARMLGKSECNATLEPVVDGQRQTIEMFNEANLKWREQVATLELQNFAANTALSATEKELNELKVAHEGLSVCYDQAYKAVPDYVEGDSLDHCFRSLDRRVKALESDLAASREAEKRSESKAVEFALGSWRSETTSISMDGWRLTDATPSHRALEYLYSAGVLEKHPEHDWYRWLPSPATDEPRGGSDAK